MTYSAKLLWAAILVFSTLECANNGGCFAIMRQRCHPTFSLTGGQISLLPQKGQKCI
jgi:hypothetical protein